MKMDCKFGCIEILLLRPWKHSSLSFDIREKHCWRQCPEILPPLPAHSIIHGHSYTVIFLRPSGPRLGRRKMENCTKMYTGDTLTSSEISTKYTRACVWIRMCTHTRTRVPKQTHTVCLSLWTHELKCMSEKESHEMKTARRNCFSGQFWFPFFMSAEFRGCAGSN